MKRESALCRKERNSLTTMCLVWLWRCQLVAGQLNLYFILMGGRQRPEKGPETFYLFICLVIIFGMVREEFRTHFGDQDRTGAATECSTGHGGMALQSARHEYEYCDFCVNRSDDNMLDVCFQESQLTRDPTTTAQQCNKGDRQRCQSS